MAKRDEGKELRFLLWGLQALTKQGEEVKELLTFYFVNVFFAVVVVFFCHLFLVVTLH